MPLFTEKGTINERLMALVIHFALGNKTAFGRAAELESGLLAGIVGSRQSKPSFEVLQKILAGYPTVSPDWLLFGTGGMLRDQAAVNEAVVMLPPAAQPGSGIRTRLIYSCQLPQQGTQDQETFSLEAIRYLPYQVKKKHKLLEEAEGDSIHVTDAMLDTERGEHLVYLATVKATSKQHLEEMRGKLVAKGWVDEGLLDHPEQFRLLSNGEPNPVYDPRFDGIFPKNQDQL